MRRYVGIALLFLVSMVLQTTVFDFLKVAGVKPDLVVLLVIYFAFTNGPYKGAAFGLLIGLLEDLIVGYNVGLNALALLFTGFLAGWFETKMYKENLVIAFLVVFLGSIVSQSVILFAGFFAGFNWQLANNFNFILAISIYNTCLVPFTYPFFYHSITKGILRYRPKHEN